MTRNQYEKTSYLKLFFLIIFGVIISGWLTWFMYFLIQTGEQTLDDSTRSYMLDFVRVKRDEVSHRKERTPEKAPIEKAPPAPDVQQMENVASNIDAIPISDLNAGNADVDINVFKINTGDGEYLPIVKIVPVYPFRSLNAGIEGNCSVMYTVTTSGATRDIRVIEARCPNKDFRKSSTKAASKFKYKPKIINGEPVEVHNVVNTFMFEINDAEGDSE